MNEDDNLPSAKRPIGFWIKAADRALEQAIDAAHARDGFTRRRWQVLSLIVRHGSVAQSDLVAELAPMMEGKAVKAELNALAEHGLVANADGLLGVTAAGQEAHRRLAKRQAEIRREAMSGIDPEDYAAAIRCLSRIAENLSHAAVLSAHASRDNSPSTGPAPG